MKRLFFSQGMLDSMVEAGKIRVDKGILTMLAGDNPTFKLLPAYRIVKTIDGKPDPAGLVGQIRAEAEVKALGAIWRELMGRAFPTMSVVFVTALVEKEAMIEIETTAVILD